MSRVRFTDAELQAIISMAAIAGAGSTEGDYADWTDATYNAASGAAGKAHEMLAKRGLVYRNGEWVKAKALSDAPR